MHPVTIEQGEVLGTLELLREVTTVDAVNTVRTKQGSQKPGMGPEERMNQLLSELNMEETEARPTQSSIEFINFSDVFALNQSELGRTDLIKHCIDRGGQGPVKQLPYHTSSRLTVVSREAKEEVPCDGLSTNAREYFTRTNLAKTKNTITYEP